MGTRYYTIPKSSPRSLQSSGPRPLCGFGQLLHPRLCKAHDAFETRISRWISCSLKASSGANYCALQGTGAYVEQRFVGAGSSLIVEFYTSGRDGFERCKLGVYINGRPIMAPITPGIGFKKHRVRVRVKTASGTAMLLKFQNEGDHHHRKGDVTVFLDTIHIIGCHKH